MFYVQITVHLPESSMNSTYFLLNSPFHLLLSHLLNIHLHCFINLSCNHNSDISLSSISQFCFSHSLLLHILSAISVLYTLHILSQHFLLLLCLTHLGILGIYLYNIPGILASSNISTLITIIFLHRCVQFGLSMTLILGSLRASAMWSLRMCKAWRMHSPLTVQYLLTKTLELT